MSTGNNTPTPPADRASLGTAQGETASVVHANRHPNAAEALAKLRAAGVQPVEFKGLIITNPPPPQRAKPLPSVPQSPAWFRFAVLYLAFAVVVALVLRARR